MFDGCTKNCKSGIARSWVRTDSSNFGSSVFPPDSQRQTLYNPQRNAAKHGSKERACGKATVSKGMFCDGRSRPDVFHVLRGRCKRPIKTSKAVPWQARRNVRTRCASRTSRILEDVNRRRGSVAPAYKGQTFVEITELWRTAVAPNLSPATVRQRESYLRAHVLPRFKDVAPHTLDVAAMQEFATHLRKTLSRKTVINILSAVFSILDYAGRCGTRISKVRFADLQLGSTTNDQRGAFLTRDQAVRVIRNSAEPYHTMFATRGQLVCVPANCWHSTCPIWILKGGQSVFANPRTMPRAKFVNPKRGILRRRFRCRPRWKQL